MSPRQRDRFPTLTQLAERLAQAAQAPGGELETPCPDALTLVRYREGHLDPAAAEMIATHLAECAVCRRVV